MPHFLLRLFFWHASYTKSILWWPIMRMPTLILLCSCCHFIVGLKILHMNSPRSDFKQFSAIPVCIHTYNQIKALLFLLHVLYCDVLLCNHKSAIVNVFMVTENPNSAPKTCFLTLRNSFPLLSYKKLQLISTGSTNSYLSKNYFLYWAISCCVVTFLIAVETQPTLGVSLGLRSQWTPS